MIYYTLEDFKKSYKSHLDEYLNSYVDNREIDFLNQLKQDYLKYIENVKFYSNEFFIDTVSRFKGVNQISEIEDKIFEKGILNTQISKKFESSFMRIIEHIDSQINKKNIVLSPVFKNIEIQNLFYFFEEKWVYKPTMRYAYIYEHLNELNGVTFKNLYQDFVFKHIGLTKKIQYEKAMSKAKIHELKELTKQFYAKYP